MVTYRAEIEKWMKTPRLLATGQTRCYDKRGNEIDCTSTDYPGQDGFYRAGCTIEGRFVDNGDGTVTDTCTGLMWQKDTAPGTYTWQAALQYCENLDFAGHADWRLPNLRELQSIIDSGRSIPGIDPVFGAVSDHYWSSSTYVYTAGHAWYIQFADGYINVADLEIHDYVRAVRGGL